MFRRIFAAVLLAAMPFLPPAIAAATRRADPAVETRSAHPLPRPAKTAARGAPAAIEVMRLAPEPRHHVATPDSMRADANEKGGRPDRG